MKFQVFVECKDGFVVKSGVGTLRDARNFAGTFLGSLPFVLFEFIQAKSSVSGFSSIYIRSAVFTTYKSEISIW